MLSAHAKDFDKCNVEVMQEKISNESSRLEI